MEDLRVDRARLEGNDLSLEVRPGIVILPRKLYPNLGGPTVDVLLEKGRRTLLQEERKKLYDRFQEILAEEQPYTFLYVPDALPVVAERFRGIEPAPAGIMHNFIEWYVPAGQHKYTR